MVYFAACIIVSYFSLIAIGWLTVIVVGLTTPRCPVCRRRNTYALVDPYSDRRRCDDCRAVWIPRLESGRATG